MITTTRRNILCLLLLLFSLPLLSQPVINSFSPASGPVGTVVTITGNNFSTTPANNIVFFGGVRANVSTSTATSLTVTAPVGSTYQPITVTVNGLSAYSSRPFIITFSGGVLTPNAFEYAANADNVTGIETNDMAIADMDGDGKPDLIVTDNTNGFFAFYKNTSAGALISFGPRIGFQVGNGSHYIVVGEIDGDGKPDVSVTNSNDNNVSIFRNTTAGGVLSFAPKVNISAGVNCIGITLADFDADGKPDIATVSSNLDGTITLIRNTSTLGVVSFAPKTEFNTIGIYSKIEAADIDIDGKPDLVVTNLALNIFSVFRNISTPGSITFASKVDFVSGPNPDRLSTGDIDGDGKNDVIISYLNSNFISVYRNTSSAGTVAFATRNDHVTGSASTIADGSTMNDLDGDSKPDLSVINILEYISIFKNNSTAGNISLGTRIDIPASSGSKKILSCDFNSDGRPEIAVIFNGIFRVTVWRNKTTEPQITSFSPTTSGSGATITITGGNLTGVTAVSFGGVPASSFTIVNSATITAVVGSGASGSVTVNAPHGTGTKAGYTYVPNPTITSFTPTTGTLGLTITITGSNFTGATAVTFGGVPASSFTVVNATTITAVVGSGASGNVTVTTPGGTVSLGGFTYIPMPDVISFTPTTGTINTTVTITGNNFTGATDVRFGGIPAGSFTVVSPTTITATVLGGLSGAVRVTTPGGTDSLNGFVFIQPPAPVITSFAPTNGAVGTVVTITGNNFNTDPTLNYVYFGPSRAVVSSATANTLIVIVPPGAAYSRISVTTNFLTAITVKPFIVTFPGGGGISSNSFEGPVTFATGTSPIDASVTDLDGDNKDDLAVVNSSGSISVLRNTSTGGNLSFDPKVDFYAGLDPWRILTAEIDGDGKKDIVVIDKNQKRLYVYKNTSVPGTISLASKIDYTLAQTPGDFRIDDFDADGKPDIVIVFNTLMSIFRNTSVVNNISFAPPIDYTVAFSLNAVSTGDIDGDGKTDIAYLNSAMDSAYVMRNTSLATGISFAPGIAYATKIDNIQYFGPTDIVIADLDNDDKPEMTIANTTASMSISIWKNNSLPGTISFSTRTDLLTWYNNIQPFTFSIEDMDGDGKPDIAFGHEYVPRTLCIIKNTSTTGTLSFAGHVDYTDNSNGSLGRISTGDLDGDGRPEMIAVNNNNNGPLGVYIYKNKTNGPHITSFTPTNGVAGTSVTITGLNFTGATAVSFGGVAAASFVVNSSTSITAVVGNGAAGNVSLATPLGTASAPGFLFGLLPTITSFTPASGATGTIITITGTNFTGASAVSFGGESAGSFTVVSPTTITATVWLGASGNVSVTVPGGTASLPGFVYIPPAPVINSFSPQSGVTGTLVTISGSNFTGATVVSFGAIPASSFTIHGPSLITATVAGGATGSVSVTTPGGTGSKTGFTFIQTTITSFSPATAATGAIITITGTNFTGATAVSFGGVPATSFTVVNETTITAVVANGASGNVVVTTPNGTGTLAGFTFIPAPAITSFTPASGTTGATITITGTNLTGATAVSFGGIAASSFTVNSSTSITAVVATGASGNVSVTTPGGTASLSGFIYNFPTGINGPGNNNSKELSVFPNPSDDLILIKHPATIKNAEIRFVDILGREVKLVIPLRNTKQTETSVKKLSRGVYQIIWSDGQLILSRTFMVH